MKRAAYGFMVISGLLCVGIATAATPGQQEKQNQQGAAVQLGNLQSRAPAEWMQEQPGTEMRYKQFRLPAVAGDKHDGELIIFYFGKRGGGSAADNVKRWKGMFVPPEGKKIDDVAKVDKLPIGGETATYLDVHGTYLSKFPPFAPNARTIRHPKYRMLAVVFPTADSGPYYIRLVGPEATVGHYKKGFDEWLKAFK